MQQCPAVDGTPAAVPGGLLPRLRDGTVPARCPQRLLQHTCVLQHTLLRVLLLLLLLTLYTNSDTSWGFRYTMPLKRSTTPA